MTIKREEIENYIPHRGDMLLLDEMREYTPLSGVGIHYVKPDAFWAAGHFPSEPIMPGVLQVEALAQVACFVVIKELMKTDSGKKVGYFTALEKVRFLQKVQPGDTLELCVEQTAQKMKLYKFQGTAMVRGMKVCEASFSAVIGELPE